MSSSTFHSHTFLERGETGKNNPQWDKKRLLVIKKIPGGNANEIQSIGDDVQRLAMPIACTASELSALYGEVGTSDALHTWSGADCDALLEAIDGVIEVKPGKDLYWAILHFIKR